MIFAGTILIALAAVAAYVSTRPGTIFIQRSIAIDATREAVFALVGDFRNWPLWAPQDRDDPTFVRRYGEVAQGLGAVSDWTSKGRSGAGRMTIVGLTPGSEIVVAVHFERPFKAENINTFTLESAGESATRVTWSMRGANVLMLRFLSLFGGVDRVLGPHFETGLANLKAIAERRTP